MFFEAYWKNNQDLSNSQNVFKLLESLEIDSEEFIESIKRQKIKDELIKLTSEAFNKEVFGAPTFVVNNKIFWGQDRLDYALDEYNT